MMSILSDLSTSEADLKHYTWIIRSINFKAMDKEELDEKIKEGLELKNRYVRNKHINLLRELDLIRKEENEVRLTGTGRTFYSFICERPKDAPLTLSEKLFLLKTFFTKKTFLPLYEFLMEVKKNPSGLRREIVKAYFDSEKVQKFRIWKRATFTSKYKNRENKLRSLEKWLEQMDLLLVGSGRIALSEKGEKILNELINLENEEVSKRIFSVITVILKSDCKKFSQKDHEVIFLRYLKDSYEKFKRGPDFSDMIAMRNWICIKLLENEALVLEEHEFNSVISKLWREERIVRGVMRGENFVPRYISLGSQNSDIPV